MQRHPTLIHRFTATLVAAATILLVPVSGVNAAIIFDHLFDMESPDIADGARINLPTSGSHGSGFISQYTRFGSNRGYHMDSTGVAAETPSSGSQILGVFRAGATDPYALNGLSLPGSPGLATGVQYTVSFNAGNYSRGNDTTDTIVNQVDLLAGGTSVANGSITTTNGNLSLNSHSFQFTAGPSHPQIGQELTLRLIHGGGDFRELALFDDVRILAETISDTDPPTPDPGAWALAPRPETETSMFMRATEATDGSGVEYRFINTTTGSETGWQASRDWLETGLTPGVNYEYQVQARDLSPDLNETGLSLAQTATPPAGLLFHDGFEKTEVTGITPAGAVVPPGWLNASPPGVGSNRIGLWNEDSGTMTTPFDSQAAWIWYQRAIETDASGLDHQLRANTNYSLSFNVASESGGNAGNPTTYLAELIVDGQVVSSVTGTTTSSNFADVADSLTFNTGLWPENFGGDVSIRFSHPSGDFNYVLGVDNVSLFGSSVSEKIWDGSTNNWQNAHWGTPVVTPPNNESMIVNGGTATISQDLTATNPIHSLYVARDAAAGTVNVGDGTNAGGLLATAGVVVLPGGTINVNNGTLNASDQLEVAGGTVTVATAGTVAVSPGSGVVNVAPTGTLIVNGDLQAPTLNTEGTTTIAGGGTVGTLNANAGTLAVATASSAITTLNAAGATVNSTGAALADTLNLTAGAVNLAADAAVDTVTVTAGQINAGANNLIISSSMTLDTVSYSGTNFGAGGTITKDGVSRLEVNGGTLTISPFSAMPGTDVITNQPSTINFVTASPATLGNVTVLSGQSLDLTGAPEYRFNNLIGGDGATITANGGSGGITVSGLLSPGNSPGTLNIVGDYTQDATSTYLWEFENGASDLITVSNDLFLETGWTLSLSLLAGDVIDTDVFEIFTVGNDVYLDGGLLPTDPFVFGANAPTIANSFAGPGGNFDLSSAQVYFDSGSVYLTGIVSVPEPGTWALLGLLLLAGITYQRRRRKS